MAAFFTTHAAKSVENAAQAVSDVASRGSDAATTAERIIIDVASAMLMMSALYGFKLAIASYMNQLPEVVDTLLKIKTFLEQQPLDEDHYGLYKKIQKEIIIAGMDNVDGFMFSLVQRYRRFRAYKTANKEARRLLEKVKLSATKLIQVGCELRELQHNIEIPYYKREETTEPYHSESWYDHPHEITGSSQHAPSADGINFDALYRCNGPGINSKPESDKGELHYSITACPLYDGDPHQMA